MRWVVLVLGLVLASEVAAANLRSAMVDETQAGRYRVRLEIDLDASSRQVYSVLTDLRPLRRPASTDIQRAGVLGPGASKDSTRVETWIHACVTFFCHEIHPTLWT